MFNIAENAKVVNVAAPADFSGAALTTEWINMKNAQKATFLVSLGALDGSVSSAVVTLNVANDASGTKSATAAASMDLPFEYYYKGGALPSDTFTKTTVSSSTFTLANTDDNRILAIEVDAAAMGQFTSGSSTYEADYVRLAIAIPGGAALMSAVCLLTGLRYAQDAPPTAIT